MHLVGLRMGDKMCKIADGKRGGRKGRGGEVDVIRTFSKLLRTGDSKIILMGGWFCLCFLLLPRGGPTMREYNG